MKHSAKGTKTKKFTYAIEERGAYIRYAVNDIKSKELILEFFTNSDREGRWWYDNARHEYHQAEGTAQFAMPENARSVSAKLRRMAEVALEEAAERKEGEEIEREFLNSAFVDFYPYDRAESYVTLKDWAASLGVVPRTARVWVENGKLPAARKIGRDWFIPPDTPRPADRRYVENPIRNRRKNEPETK